MKEQWRIKDIIDLEYFFHCDEERGDETSQKALLQRDRTIYLKHIQPLINHGKLLFRRDVIKAWLTQRRHLEKRSWGSDAILPGDAFEEIHRVLVYIFLVFGGMTGAGMSSTFLAYTGTEPLNVSIYLGGLVLIQILLLLFLMAFSLVRLLKPSILRRSVVYSLVSNLLVRLALKVKKRSMNKLPGTQRDSIQVAMGLARGKKQIYGPLFYWPAFILLQIFGVGFNLGVLCATLVKVIGSDIAFGWQSTVQVSPQALYDIIRAIALPWSWFISPEIAHPTLAQIEGSRMVLKDGIYHLATQDLVSWWPFLCFTVLFYGLLPRAILLITGLMAQLRSLRVLDLCHSACDKLMHRLETPLVSSKGHKADIGADEYFDTAATRPSESTVPGQKNSISEKSLIALVPDEIFDECPDNELRAVIWKALKRQVRDKIRIDKDRETDGVVLEGLSQTDWGEVQPEVLILQEAWQPPIKEILSFIRDLRKTLGERFGIQLALIGKPGPDTIFTPVKEIDWNTWNQKINIMGDPYLRLKRLVQDE
jgi:hypothetical protein